MPNSASCSCSHWWHAPIYFTAAAILAFTAISSALNSSPTTTTTTTLWNDPTLRLQTLNASKTLRRSGFTIIATLLQISPELFFLSPNTTVFAIQDSSFSDLSVPLKTLKPLLQYHTSPTKIEIGELRNKPSGLCLPTLLTGKDIVVTKSGSGSIEINNVSISHPNLFIGGSIFVHGVNGPFSKSDPRMGWEFIRPPECRHSGITPAPEWDRVVQVLSSNGFVAFAIGLHSVLDRILGDFPGNLSSVTIFTPPEFAYIASPLPVLEKVVRFHIVPERLTFMDLVKASSLQTLVPGRVLEVAGAENFTINGAEVAEFDVFTSKKFVVHAISRVFEVSNLFEEI